MKFYLPILLLATCSFHLWAQDTIQVDTLLKDRVIGGQWSYLNGVDSNWQEISDRSGWGSLTTQFSPDTLQEQFSGLAWFSKTIRVADNLKGKFGAMILTTRGGAIESYVNGIQVAQYGSPSMDPEAEVSEIALYRDFIAFQFDTTDYQRIDIRLSDHSKNEVAGFLLAISSTKEASKRLRQSTFNMSSIVALIIGSFIAFSLIHLLLFFYYKEDRSNLFYGLATSCIAILAIFFLLGRFTSDQNDLSMFEQFVRVTGYSAFYFLLRVLYEIFYTKAPRRQWGILTLLLVVLVMGFLTEKTSTVLGLIYVGICVLEFILIIVRAIRNRKAGGKNLGVGLLGTVLGILGFFLTTFVIVSLLMDEFGNFPSEFVRISVAIAAFLSLVLMLYSVPLSMSLFISRKSAETNESLKMQLIKVEELSAETLRQEREKQTILEGQKQMLETEVRNQTVEIREQRDRSDQLLLNILPAEIAEELKEKGEAEAKLVENVTVIFTDFKGFTAMSEILSPKDLVNDLNLCFSEFDKIMSEHNIEKIKTIGDAYMAAGGIPSPNKTHARDAIRAALRMRDFVEAGKRRKLEEGLPFFEIRIGIHTGPVVAGIVGIKKFQYDIWGDTVNTASRMESSGKEGKVNVSQSTYEIIKDDPAFTFESRGMIEAKSKGEMEMYFVSRKV